MAHDFLPVSLSIVSSKYAFTLGGRIFGEKRSSLTLRCRKLLYVEKVGCSRKMILTMKKIYNA
jgi:hypothetical protein